jgi:hypothetical protein
MLFGCSCLFRLHRKVYWARLWVITAVAPSADCVTVSPEESERKIEISRLALDAWFYFPRFLHHGQHHVTQVLYRMEERPLLCAADSVFADGISRKKPVIVRYSPGVHKRGTVSRSARCACQVHLPSGESSVQAAQDNDRARYVTCTYGNTQRNTSVTASKSASKQSTKQMKTGSEASISFSVSS